MDVWNLTTQLSLKTIWNEAERQDQQRRNGRGEDERGIRRTERRRRREIERKAGGEQEGGGMEGGRDGGALGCSSLAEGRICAGVGSRGGGGGGGGSIGDSGSDGARLEGPPLQTRGKLVVPAPSSPRW